MSKAKMPWLKDRLRQIDRTPAGLARHLNIGGPRVYEMIAGRRGMQPNEIEPTAEYLGWSKEQLLEKLPEEARIVPYALKTSGIPVLATTRTWDLADWDLLLTGETTRYVEPPPALKGRADIQALYMGSDAMEPWRNPGDLVLFEKDRPPREHDYVVVYLVEAKRSPRDMPTDVRAMTRVMVRQLLGPKGPGKVRLRQHNPRRDVTIDRKTVAGMFRVMTWEDCVR